MTAFAANQLDALCRTYWGFYPSFKPRLCWTSLWREPSAMKLLNCRWISVPLSTHCDFEDAWLTDFSSRCLSGMPRFAIQPSAASVHVGSNQVMACEVNSDLVPFARWEKDKQPLELNTRLLQLPSGALVISNASDSDAGLYRCLVENVGSSKWSEEAQLQVLPGNLSRGVKLFHLWL